MRTKPLRGIAVVDAGYTNLKIALLDAEARLVAERKLATVHRPGPPYPWLDPEVLKHLCEAALPELDRILPIDAVVPCGHGAALALIDANGDLALPVLDYMTEPPAAIVNAYRKLEPPFSEVFCPLLPMSLTHALQLYWQQNAFPAEFARVATVIPWIQYPGYMLGGRLVSEISSLCCQTQLIDIRTSGPSSLAKAQGWDRLMAPMAKAWEAIGTLKPAFRGDGFRGEGRILGGVHDSNANYLRYLAAGREAFTLVSTGTWIISFDNATRAADLDPARDTNTNTDVLGNTVACSRFFGGKEFEVAAAGAPAEAASLDGIERLVARGSFALPSFTDSGGPIPGTGNRGAFEGPVPATPEERASLATLYCALMVSEQLDAVHSKNDIVVDGPFALNPVFLGLLATLRAPQPVFASSLRDGTIIGAAVLALMEETGVLPRIGLELRPIAATELPGLAAYRQKWLERIRQR